MWDYDKLFAEGNIIGFYVPLIEKYTVHVIDEKQKNILYNYYKNKLLSYSGPIISYEDMKTKIQYIVRLDEHGNVIEKLFDREEDMIDPLDAAMAQKTVNELCSNCIHKDVFWKNAGCNLKNGMEPCNFEPKEKSR